MYGKMTSRPHDSEWLHCTACDRF